MYSVLLKLISNNVEKKRLESLDILRGMDLFLLLIIGPVIQIFLSINKNPSLDWMRSQFEHVQWEGFVLWDIIMPLFMFMSGITIPFSMKKFKSGKYPLKTFWGKLAKRFILLFFLGWIVQGNLLALDYKIFHPFANTLQAIAVGYIFTAIAFVYLNLKWRIAFGAICFIAYFLVFAIAGELNPEPINNIAMRIDEAILAGHRDYTLWLPDGTYKYDPAYQYTWIISSLNFIVTVLLGCLTGELLCSENTPIKKTVNLFIFGISLILAGLALSPVFPIIKKIWNSSMTLYSGGICIVLMGILYYIVDVRGWSKGLNWFKYFGMNSILAYCVGEVVNFNSIGESLLTGLRQFTGNYYPVLITCSSVTILFFILKVLYKNKIYIKI